MSWAQRQLASMVTDPEVLVQPEAVHWDQDSVGLVSVVVVQACCARLAAAKRAETRAARCAILKTIEDS